MSGDFEAAVAENSQIENLVAGLSRTPKIQAEKLDEIKTSLRNEIMSGVTKIYAENQKELLKLIAPTVKELTIHQNMEASDSETENTHPASTSTPKKSKATTSKSLR